MALRISALMTVALLSACATTPRNDPVWPYHEPPEADSGSYERNERASSQPAQEPVRQESAQPAAQAPRGDRAETDGRQSHGAVDALVQQARDEVVQGELERAAATLERAIRIAPKDPLPWVELAKVRFEQANLIQAENLARRSLSYASRGATAREAWLLIADVKRLQGDSQAADEALRRANEA